MSCMGMGGGGGSLVDCGSQGECGFAFFHLCLFPGRGRNITSQLVGAGWRAGILSASLVSLISGSGGRSMVHVGRLPCGGIVPKLGVLSPE